MHTCSQGVYLLCWKMRVGAGIPTGNSTMVTIVLIFNKILKWGIGAFRLWSLR